MGAGKKHSANLFLCRVPLTDTRQTPNGRHTNWQISTWLFFAECLYFIECFLALDKEFVCRVQLFCWVFFLQHSAKILFAECPKDCTRQTPLHSANWLFPVVMTPILEFQSSRSQTTAATRQLKQGSTKTTTSDLGYCLLPFLWFVNHGSE